MANLFLEKITKHWSLNRWKLHIEARTVFNPTTGCLVWFAGKNSDGYPTAGKFPHQEKGHRVAYQLYHPHEDITTKTICHTCDNPACVAEAHLIAASKAYNNLDKTLKGRGNQPKGVDHFNSKVSEAQVREIRSLYKRGVVLREIAATYGLSISTAQKIGAKIYYRHVE